MAKKMTKVEMFKAIMSKYDLAPSEVEFIEHEIELLEKKNSSRKPSKAQTENEGYKTAILEGMEEGKFYTITDLIKSISAIGELTNQRVSALVRQLKEEDLVLRKEEKGKAYFSLA